MKQLTLEHRQKISMSLKGKPKPPGFGQKVSQALKDEEKLVERLKNELERR